MKTKFLSFALFLLVLLTLWFTPPVEAQVTPTTYGSFISTTDSVATEATEAATSTAVAVQQGRGLAVFPYFATTNASTANVIFTFNVSYDGTNYSTTGPITLTNALNGTTAVRGYHLITPDRLDNVQKIKLSTIQNVHTATIWVTNVTWSIRN